MEEKQKTNIKSRFKNKMDTYKERLKVEEENSTVSFNGFFDRLANSRFSNLIEDSKIGIVIVALLSILAAVFVIVSSFMGGV